MPVQKEPGSLGTDVSFPSVDVIAEFIGDADNLQTLRIAFIADTLDDVEGRRADYSKCHPISRYNRPDTRLDLLLHLGFDEELNECVLSKLGPGDRRKWEDLLDNFDRLVDALAPAKAPKCSDSSMRSSRSEGSDLTTSCGAPIGGWSCLSVS